MRTRPSFGSTARAVPGLRALLAATVCIASFASGSAQANLLSNGSFDGAGSTSNAAFAPGSTAISGWVILGNPANPGANIQWINNVNPYGTMTPFGSAFIDLTGLSDSAPYAGLLTAFATTVGTSYRVTFDLGYDNGSTVGNFGGPVSAFASIDGFVVGTFTTTSAGSGNEWQSFEYDFVADSNTSVLRILGNSGGVYIGLDNVDVEVAAVTPPPANGSVPEPASLALVGLGIAGAIVARRKAR